MAELRRTGTVDLEAKDGLARARALDAGRSFLVQAPAGSGKTALLIQRFLALLAHTERPEGVVAMTFTKKAAAEMRERVLAALRDADADVPVDPSHPNHLVTRRLAVAALAQDRRRGWQLIAQPARLRMMTIDALAAALARQAPVATGLGALPAFVEDASALYAAAAHDALAAADADDPAWRRFLSHVDNDADLAARLLAALLAKRDQWLRLPMGGGNGEEGGDLRAMLERGLRAEVEAALGHTHAAFDDVLRARLPEFERHAAARFETVDGCGDLAAALRRLASGGGIPDATADALDDWRTLANWLLVKGDAQFRVKVTKNNGFPAAKGGTAAAAPKSAFEAWLAEAADVPGLAAALSAVRDLPPPRYSNDAWAFVDAALVLLRNVAGRLLTVFAREGKTDFSEATLRALAALGNADDPGELLLAVDYRIEHLLVDEFQDTSWAQLALIERLTSGWEAGDGRTLFAVGDPMQSIYRFREAEVGIFVDAQARGRIGGVDVECLDLARNFRSRPAVVDWLNRVFPHVLPGADDAARGEVAYKPVLAAGGGPAGAGDENDCTPTLDIVVDRYAEADAVVRRIRAAEKAGAHEIAVLVRARTHLDAILPALRRAGIAFAARDLESLADRLATRDLASLTRALVQPTDRLAAFAVLRAPWCGLTLADLLALATVDGARPILE
ncbi:MAG: UvrD-helicase domain-containing protein, partial [Betaproteobacteria bacterium]